MNIPDNNYLINGYTGLCNLGNTCFLNSCIQVLSHTYELHKVLNKPLIQRQMTTLKTDEMFIFKEWKELIEVMWSGNGKLRPMKFVKAVHEISEKKGIEIFTGFAQNDVTEFLRFIVNCFHTAMSRPVQVNITGTTKSKHDDLAVQCYGLLNSVFSKEYSDIFEIFYGISVSEIRGKNNAVHSLKPEQYFILDLPIPKVASQTVASQTVASKNISIYDCMDLFTTSEIMSGDNAWFNEKTGLKEDVTKKNLFWNFPKILIIALKRFEYIGTNCFRINSQIDAPLNGLDLSKYVDGYSPKKYIYDLYGVCNHMGGPMGGHYTAYVKNVAGKWLNCNDETVSIIENLNEIVTSTAYCLFYRIRE
jgi:ubiquitin carboxyl-terminal hydrolase 2/21